MKKTFAPFLLFLLLVACGQPTKLNGSIFIVQENAQNVKLGSVTVAVYREEIVGKYIGANEYSTVETFFNNPLSPVTQTTSDAEGKFNLTIPKSGKYVIAAHSERRVFDKKEKYYWLVPLSATGASQEIVLTNSNMTKTTTEDY